MKKTRHTPNQIIMKLRKVEAARAEGRTVNTVLNIGAGEQAYYWWKREYGSMDCDQLKRLKDLKRENKRLKKLIADLSLGENISMQAFKLIRQMIPGGDQENDIFIVGDAHQRIYDRQVVLKHCGINIVGPVGESFE